MKTIKIHYSVKLVTFLSVALLTLSSCSKEESSSVSTAIAPTDADTLVINAKAWIGNPDQPWVETIAIKNSRIIATGNKALETQFSAGKIIDAEGKLVLPGFIDNHVHFMGGAETLLSIDTQSAKTRQAFITTIRDYALSVSEGE